MNLGVSASTFSRRANRKVNMMKSIDRDRVLRINCPGFGEESSFNLGRARSLDNYQVIIANPVSLLHLFDKGPEPTRRINQLLSEGINQLNVPDDALIQELINESDARLEELIPFLSQGGLLIYFLCRPFVLAGPTISVDNYDWLSVYAPATKSPPENGTRQMSALSHGRIVEVTDEGATSDMAEYLQQSGIEWNTIIRTDFLSSNYSVLATAAQKKCISAQFWAGDNGGKVVFLPAPYSPDFDRALMNCVNKWYNEAINRGFIAEPEAVPTAAEAVKPSGPSFYSEQAPNADLAPSQAQAVYNEQIQSPVSAPAPAAAPLPPADLDAIAASIAEPLRSEPAKAAPKGALKSLFSSDALDDDDEFSMPAPTAAPAPPAAAPATQEAVAPPAVIPSLVTAEDIISAVSAEVEATPPAIPHPAELKRATADMDLSQFAETARQLVQQANEIESSMKEKAQPKQRIADILKGLEFADDEPILPAEPTALPPPHPAMQVEPVVPANGNAVAAHAEGALPYADSMSLDDSLTGSLTGSLTSPTGQAPAAPPATNESDKPMTQAEIERAEIEAASKSLEGLLRPGNEAAGRSWLETAKQHHAEHPVQAQIPAQDQAQAQAQTQDQDQTQDQKPALQPTISPSVSQSPAGQTLANLMQALNERADSQQHEEAASFQVMNVVEAEPQATYVPEPEAKFAQETPATFAQEPPVIPMNVAPEPMAGFPEPVQGLSNEFAPQAAPEAVDATEIMSEAPVETISSESPRQDLRSLMQQFEEEAPPQSVAPPFQSTETYDSVPSLASMSEPMLRAEEAPHPIESAPIEEQPVNSIPQSTEEKQNQGQQPNENMPLTSLANLHISLPPSAPPAEQQENHPVQQAPNLAMQPQPTPSYQPQAFMTPPVPTVPPAPPAQQPQPAAPAPVMQSPPFQAYQEPQSFQYQEPVQAHQAIPEAPVQPHAPEPTMMPAQAVQAQVEMPAAEFELSSNEMAQPQPVQNGNGNAPGNGHAQVEPPKDLMKRMEEMTKLSGGWCDQFSFPYLDQMRGEHHQLAEQIRLLQERLHSAETRIEHLDKLKSGLLVGSGDALSEAVSEVLAKMGWQIQFSESNAKEFWLSRGGQVEIIARVVSSVGAANRSEIAQLAESVIAFWDEREIEPKGLLIAQTWSELAPAERTEPDFSPALQEFAAKKHLCVMSTIQLLAMFKDLELNAMAGDEMRQRMLETNGRLLGFLLESNLPQAATPAR